MVIWLSICLSKDARLILTKMMCKMECLKVYKIGPACAETGNLGVATYRYTVSPCKYPGMWYAKLCLTPSNYFHFAVFLARATEQKADLMFDTGITQEWKLMWDL